MPRPQFYSTFHGQESIHHWCQEFYQHAADSGRFFRTSDGFLLFIDQSAGPRRIMNVTDFFGTIPSLVDVVRPTEDGQALPAMLQYPHTMTLFGSEAKLRLPLVENVVREPVVVWAGGSYVLVETPGYDPTAKVYLFCAPEAPVIKARTSTTALEQVFSGVPFQNEGYRANVMAWLLSAVVLDKRLAVPMLTVTGNDRGVGKSSLVQASGIILTGELQSAVQYRGGELEKQVSARFIENGRFIALDNVVVQGGGTFKNERLARLLTDGWSKRVRILGQSRSVAQQGVLFSLTANDAKLDPDLATRSLMVNLYREIPQPMRPFCVEEAFALRAEAYGELLGLAMQPVDQIKQAIEPLFRFRHWLDFCVPRICPKFGQLALQQAQELDDRVQDLFSYGADNQNDPFTAESLYKGIRGDYERFPGLSDYIGTGRGEHGKRIKLAKYIAREVGTSLYVSPELQLELKLARPSTRKEPAEYIFRKTQ